MENGYREINLGSWKRVRHLALYERSAYPYVGVSANLEITHLLEICRARDLNFFSAFLFVAMQAMNRVENFRYRIADGGVRLYDRIDPSFTVFDPDDELFYFAYAPLCPKPALFYQRVEEAKQSALREKCLSGNELDVVHISCLPWFGFYDIIQPLTLDGGAPSSVPKLMWGKFETAGGKTTIPFSVTAHHGLVDGFHIGRLFAAIDECTELLKN